MDLDIDNIWAANIATTAVIVAVFGYLYKRNETHRDKCIQDAVLDAKSAKQHGEKIEKNYIQRFDDVHRELAENKEEIKDHFTKEIKEVTHDKNNYRYKQGMITTQISNDIAHLVKAVDEIKNKNK